MTNPSPVTTRSDYSSSNSGLNLSRGKLETATRHHYLPGLGGQHVEVKETYTYAQTGGRVGKRRTDLDGNFLFEIGHDWDDLGNPHWLCWPLNCECGDSSTRMEADFEEGLMTSVAGYAPNISYHPNLMLSTIEHSNGVTDVWTAHASEIRRPGRIHTTGRQIH